MMDCVRHPRFLMAAGAAALLVSGCSSGVEDNSSPKAAPSVQESQTTGNQTKPSRGGMKPDQVDTVELATDPAPEFEVETFEGGTFAVREELGTPVVLNFWESW